MSAISQLVSFFISGKLVAVEFEQIMGYAKQRGSFLLRRSLIIWATIFAICILFLVLRTDDRITRSLEDYMKKKDAEISMEKQTYIEKMIEELENSVSDGIVSDSLDSDSLNSDSKIYSTLSSYDDDEYLDINQLNTTNHAEIENLYFNRVPKVGSQTFMELIKRLSIINGFTNHKDTPQRFEQVRLTDNAERNLSRTISEFEPPSSFIKHTSFTNFTKYGYPKPIYINVVRDPVERVISWFYYIRAAWYLVDRKTHFPDYELPSIEWLKKDFETCVLTGDPECVFTQDEIRESFGDHRRQTLFFCGNHPECMPFNSEIAMERAKKSVEENYPVVGVLEDLDKTLTVLDHYIPRFFKGVKDVYNDILRKNINSNSMKPPVSEYVKDIVRKNFTREIEFYEFCKNRLDKQYRALKQLNLVDQQ